MKLHVKNMVCNRCVRVVREELTKLGIAVGHVDLGEVEVAEPLPVPMDAIRAVLLANGFELLDDRRFVLIEQIKTLLINEIQHQKGEKPEQITFSDFLAKKMGYDYSYLSHLFSSVEAITIEKYIISQKIEKAKEWLSYDQLSLTDVAYRLGYSSSQHLSNQFKQQTGLTPTAFRELSQKPRRSIDQIG